MTKIEWDPKAQQFLRKLPKEIARRIFKKVDEEIRTNVERYLETLVDMDVYKIRIGDFRLFVDYYQKVLAFYLGLKSEVCFGLLDVQDSPRTKVRGFPES